MSQFVHLHVHSEYSLLDGAARTSQLVERAAELGMTSLALTDHGVMYGAIPFYKACAARGIKPIIGCEMYYTAGSLRDKGTRQEQPIYHLILLARNMAGYQNLMKLCSIGHLEGFHYKPRIDHEHLALYGEGLVCLSSCLGSEISQHLLYDRKEEARAAAERYRGIFGEHFYLEIQDHGLVEQKKVMKAMIKLSEETGIPLICTNDVHYVAAQDEPVQDILVCIGTGKTVEDEDRLKFSTNQMFLKSAEEMERLFPHVPEALANTLKVADSCSLELEFGRSILPEFKPVPDGQSAADYLADLCCKGLWDRYSQTAGWEEQPHRKMLEDRLRYELDVIDRMGYSDYFLIVWDFIRYAHENGIPVGPGRGSAAGSLVAYVLKITDVDPIRFGLLFERFLNPERVSMPDIDIDFSDEDRDRVIDYVVQKYGSGHVAQIITFGTMAAKAAVRDVGRALNVPYNEVDKAAKMIPYGAHNLEEAIKLNPDLKTLAERSARTAELLQMAMKVEGMPRHASTHAAGVVISREPLTRYVPLQEGSEQTALTQYSMENLESIGLLKMDFLGLRTLSIIQRTVRWIEEQYGVAIDFQNLPMDDEPTYELLSKGDTTGIFQLESAGMRRVLKELRPSEFEDIVSVLALYRPGPMEFIPKYIAAKHQQIEAEYPHPDLEPILADTYGIIVYQEQIMQIASRMAGFSLGESDLLRRAVSKKKREVLDEQRAHFVAGSADQGYTEEEANKVYDMIVRFADYGFPRAHATAYGVLAFRTAYLKAHFPVQFMASMLTAVVGNHRKTAEYVDECRRMGIPVLPPDVNESGVAFTPVENAGQRRAAAPLEAGGSAGWAGGTGSAAMAADEARQGLVAAGAAGQSENRARGHEAPMFGAIRFGLGAIKNVGTHAIDTIRTERRESPYADLLDFCRRVDLRVCNKRVIESLIHGGAMDSLPGHRAQLIAMLEETLEAAVKWRKEREAFQLYLEGFEEQINWTIEYPDIRPFSAMQQLEMERELLGLFLSGHPLDAYEEALKELEPDPLHLLQEYEDGAEVTVAGMIVSLKTIVSRKGQAMAFAELEDRIAKVEVVLFPETWKQASALAQKGRLVLLRAKLQQQDEDAKLLADQLLPLEEPMDRLLRLKQRRSAPAAAPAAQRAQHARTAPPAAQPQAAAAGAGASAAARGPRRPTAPRGAASAAPAGSAQRVFVKIGAALETPYSLEQLKTLLQSHPGPLKVVLFYERTKQVIELTGPYTVKPSPELFGQIESIMGKDCVKVK